MIEYDILHIEAESKALSNSEITRMKEMHLEMQNLWLKEVKAKQHSQHNFCRKNWKTKNSTYFHVVANERKEENFDPHFTWTKRTYQ
jgi:hypothetical protein